MLLLLLVYFRSAISQVLTWLRELQLQLQKNNPKSFYNLRKRMIERKKCFGVKEEKRRKQLEATCVVVVVVVVVSLSLSLSLSLFLLEFFSFLQQLQLHIYWRARILRYNEFLLKKKKKNFFFSVSFSVSSVLFSLLFLLFFSSFFLLFSALLSPLSWLEIHIIFSRKCTARATWIRLHPQDTIPRASSLFLFFSFSLFLFFFEFLR